jgi:hypothetical protein
MRTPIAIKSVITPLPRGTGTRNLSIAAYRLLLHSLWRHCKHGVALRLPLVIRNGIRVSRVHAGSMVSNTCCTTLLLQGASPP